MTATERINRLLEKEEWAKARRVIRQELQKHPNEHWLLSQLGTTYYEERKYREAMKFAERALAEAPHCPLILWDYAAALDMLGRKREAIWIYKKLLARGAKSIAYEECGEGIAWALSLLADCTYRLACCYKDVGDTKKAFKFFNAYYDDIGKGIDSIYKGEIAKTFVVQIGDSRIRANEQHSMTQATPASPASVR